MLICGVHYNLAAKNLVIHFVNYGQLSKPLPACIILHLKGSTYLQNVNFRRDKNSVPYQHSS